MIDKISTSSLREHSFEAVVFTPLCPGSAASLSLLNVVSLATGPDGSVYVGDYNLIRRIHPGGGVETILQFR